MAPPEGFAAFILTNGRPDRVITYDTLRKSGYTGPIRLLVDDLDKTREAYQRRYGDEVVVFDKRASAATFDAGDNFNDMRAIIYARNASFGVARAQGFRSFVQLDDDYRSFQYRFNKALLYEPKAARNLDAVFSHVLRFLESSGAHSVALAQGGDFIGGEHSPNAKQVRALRKCMNSFFCLTDRPFQFVGRVNEDVNTYTRGASTGLLLLTTTQVNLNQELTQSNPGGMTEMYLDAGTYVKSFYSVMFQPSSVSVRMMHDRATRIHHSVSWRRTVPKILPASFKKPAPSPAPEAGAR